MAVVNNPIRSKYIDQTLGNFSASPTGDWQTGCLWWEVVESRFHVYLKSNFASKNNSMDFLVGPITWRINLLYESRMKWTWHPSKLAVEEVSFFAGLRVVLLQLLSIHDRAVGVTNLSVVLLCPFPNFSGAIYHWSVGNPNGWVISSLTL